MCKICIEEYQFIENYSQGGFGEISKVKKNGIFYILKKCKTQNISEADSIIQEAKLHRKLNHKNIVQYIDDFIHIEFNKGRMENVYYAAMIMEYCEGGDLKKLIDERFYAKSSFSYLEILDIAYQICEGLMYLHGRGLLHRDIKSQNIFLTKNNTVRIGDFGLAKMIKKNKYAKMSIVGTDCYMAPEVIKGQEYGRSADIWCFGCVIHELETLNFMWMHEDSIGMKALSDPKHFLEPFLEDVENPKIKEILRNIFIFDKAKRIKLENLYKKIKKERNNERKAKKETNKNLNIDEDAKSEMTNEINNS